jgi:hypothetical protein
MYCVDEIAGVILCHTETDLHLQIISLTLSTETFYTLPSEWLPVIWLAYSTTILDKAISVYVI